MDMTDLVSFGTVKPTRQGGASGKTYRIDYVIVMKVQGRNLHIEGRVGGEKRAEAQVNSAAALIRK